MAQNRASQRCFAPTLLFCKIRWSTNATCRRVFVSCLWANFGNKSAILRIGSNKTRTGFCWSVFCPWLSKGQVALQELPIQVARFKMTTISRVLLFAHGNQIAWQHFTGKKHNPIIPLLLYCVRKYAEPTIDPAEGWDSYDDEMIARSPIKTADGKFHPQFIWDNHKVWDELTCTISHMMPQNGIRI